MIKDSNVGLRAQRSMVHATLPVFGGNAWQALLAGLARTGTRTHGPSGTLALTERLFHHGVDVFAPLGHIVNGRSQAFLLVRQHGDRPHLVASRITRWSTIALDRHYSSTPPPASDEPAGQVLGDHGCGMAALCLCQGRLIGLKKREQSEVL